MTRFLLTVLVLSFVIGCSTENPLCTDNYCITGEIFSKDDLEADQPFEVLPIDESALIAAIDAATVQDGTDVIRTPKITKTTADQWKTMIAEQGSLPVLKLITAPHTLYLQIADRKPEPCVSLNDEEINGVRYTLHRAIWVTMKYTSTIALETFIESSITEGKACGIKRTQMIDSHVPGIRYKLLMDMTVDGVRRLYLSHSYVSRFGTFYNTGPYVAEKDSPEPETEEPPAETPPEPKPEEPPTKTTAEEWKTLITEGLAEGKTVPALKFITVPEVPLLQVADRTPARCISFNDEEIDGVRYTLHRATWARITTTVVRGDTTRKLTVIESTITEGEACGIEETEIETNSRSESHMHLLFIDMTVDGVRSLYIASSNLSKD